jgi:cyclohexa-1,5-dienecarbonyl-CoA hydratase
MVRYERAGALGRVVLDRPPLNILDVPMLEALAAALEQARVDHGLGVLVLSGEGRAFCAGVDVAAHLAPRVRETLTLFHAVVRRVQAFAAPVVALVHGPTLGGGCELALACDIMLAREDTILGQPEIRLGVLPPVAAALLPARIGRQRALDLVLTGRSVTATEALSMGLVARCWPAESFGSSAASYLADLAGLSRPVLQLAKRAVLAGSERCFDEGLAAAESIYLDELMSLADPTEGLTAFLQKRAPHWQGA